MKPDFETYLQQAREDFCKVAHKYTITDHLELRTAVDSLLIAYDQVVEALRKHNVSGKRPDLYAMIKALEQMPDDKLDKLIQKVEAACAESAKDTVAERGICEEQCTGPWDCNCQDILKEYYSGARKSSEEQL